MLQNPLNSIPKKLNHLNTNNKTNTSLKTHFKPNCDLTIPKPNLSKLRWKLLSEAVREGFIVKPNLGSIRQFSSFNLFEMKEIGLDNKGKWFQLFSKKEKNFSLIKIRMLTMKIPINDILNGFDNTGNICIWPSEEILAYYCNKNNHLFYNKVVCELGGGMTCLSGLIVGSTCYPQHLILTDGNQRCVENVIDIVNENLTKFGSIKIDCRLLRWDDEKNNNDLNSSIDVILNADCLYFESCRQALIITILRFLKNSGIAILLAPNRGSSLEKFCDIAKNWFQVEKIINYDPIVWKIHHFFLNSLHSNIYSTDLHYPLMIKLRKI